MFEIEEIYEFIPQGMFADVNEFKTYANQNGIEDFYDYMPTGMFANVDEFTQGLKKKEIRDYLERILHWCNPNWKNKYLI